MNWLLIGLLTAIRAAAQTPAETAQSLNTQGNRVAESGNYPEAQRLYREAIQIWRSLGPEYEAHTAGTLLNLAVAMADDGQRLAAVKISEEALALHRRTLGATHHRTVANMNLLASNYLMLGDPDRAEALFREALPIERELYPRDIQTARTLEGLAYGLVRRRQAREALPLAEEALGIAIQCAGEDSMEAALAYSSVAEVHRAMGSGERALPLYRKARALYQKALGPDHPRVASILSQEGLILMQDGKLALAEQCDGAGGEVAEDGVSGVLDGTVDRGEQSGAAAVAAKTLSRGGRGVDQCGGTAREIRRETRAGTGRCAANPGHRPREAAFIR